MEKQENITTDALTEEVSALYKKLYAYMKDNGIFETYSEVFPVVGGDPDHKATAKIIDLRKELNRLAKLAKTHVKALDFILGMYEAYMEDNQL